MWKLRIPKTEGAMAASGPGPGQKPGTTRGTRRAGRESAAASPDDGAAEDPADDVVELPSESLVDAATKAIRDRILDLSLPPGKSMNSRWLVSHLGLSRTPIREALNRLAAEGLIHFETNQGVYVHPLDIPEIEQLMEAFRVCERLSAHYADLAEPGLLDDVRRMQASQRDALAAHRYLDASAWNCAYRVRIAETCRNHHIVEFYRRTANHTRRLSVMIYRMEARDPAFYESQIAMLHGLHDRMNAALEARDRDRLTTALMEQVDVFEGRIASVLRARRDRDFLAG